MSYSYVYKESGSRARQTPVDLSLLERLTSSPPVTTATYVLLLLAGAFWLGRYLDIDPTPVTNLLWNTLVYITPPSLVLALEKKYTPPGTAISTTYEGSRTFMAKSEAMRRILGFDGTSMLTNLQRSRSLSFGSVFKSPPSKALPGLGNRNNACFQNSVLQGLSSLSSLTTFLDEVIPFNKEEDERWSTNTALRGLIEQLNDPQNAGRRMWAPSALKSMSSWQQQDAQEYYSKVVDELEKEITKSLKAEPTNPGLLGLKELSINPSSDPKETEITNRNGSRKTHAEARELPSSPIDTQSSHPQNPLEGLLAQRVGCLKCGYVEGFSLIPFNCLTLPLGRDRIYDIETCLNSYTDLEPISGVECAHCTLLHQKRQLEQILGSPPSPALAAIYEHTQIRLDSVLSALESSDFSEATLSKKCLISSKTRISTTKSRQAVIARPPKCLILHVNRSIFDEHTGVQRKNYAAVDFPKNLDLTPWCLGTSSTTYASSPSSHSSPITTEKDDISVETWETNPHISMLSTPTNSESSVSDFDADSALGSEYENEKPPGSPRYLPNTLYTLRAVVTHQGRHENGHYIAYRQDSMMNENEAPSWWKLSDDDVMRVAEEQVLDQGGVFMLFYERVEEDRDKLLPNGTSNHSPTENGIKPETSEAPVENGVAMEPPEKGSDANGELHMEVNGILPQKETEETLGAQVAREEPVGNGMAMSYSRENLESGREGDLTNEDSTKKTSGIIPEHTTEDISDSQVANGASVNGKVATKTSEEKSAPESNGKPMNGIPVEAFDPMPSQGRGEEASVAITV